MISLAPSLALKPINQSVPPQTTDSTNLTATRFQASGSNIGAPEPSPEAQAQATLLAQPLLKRFTLKNPALDQAIQEVYSNQLSILIANQVSNPTSHLLSDPEKLKDLWAAAGTKAILVKHPDINPDSLFSILRAELASRPSEESIQYLNSLAEGSDNLKQLLLTASQSPKILAPAANAVPSSSAISAASLNTLAINVEKNPPIQLPVNALKGHYLMHNKISWEIVSIGSEGVELKQGNQPNKLIPFGSDTPLKYRAPDGLTYTIVAANASHVTLEPTSLIQKSSAQQAAPISNPPPSSQSTPPPSIKENPNKATLEQNQPAPPISKEHYATVRFPTPNTATGEEIIVVPRSAVDKLTRTQRFQEVDLPLPTEPSDVKKFQNRAQQNLADLPDFIRNGNTAQEYLSQFASLPPQVKNSPKEMTALVNNVVAWYGLIVRSEPRPFEDVLAQGGISFEGKPTQGFEPHDPYFSFGSTNPAVSAGEMGSFGSKGKTLFVMAPPTLGVSYPKDGAVGKLTLRGPAAFDALSLPKLGNEADSNNAWDVLRKAEPIKQFDISDLNRSQKSFLPYSIVPSEGEVRFSTLVPMSHIAFTVNLDAKQPNVRLSDLPLADRQPIEDWIKGGFQGGKIPDKFHPSMLEWHQEFLFEAAMKQRGGDPFKVQGPSMPLTLNNIGPNSSVTFHNTQLNSDGTIKVNFTSTPIAPWSPTQSMLTPQPAEPESKHRLGKLLKKFKPGNDGEGPSQPFVPLAQASETDVIKAQQRILEGQRKMASQLGGTPSFDTQLKNLPNGLTIGQTLAITASIAGSKPNNVSNKSPNNAVHEFHNVFAFSNDGVGGENSIAAHLGNFMARGGTLASKAFARAMSEGRFDEAFSSYLNPQADFPGGTMPSRMSETRSVLVEVLNGLANNRFDSKTLAETETELRLAGLLYSEAEKQLWEQVKNAPTFEAKQAALSQYVDKVREQSFISAEQLQEQAITAKVLMEWAKENGFKPGESSWLEWKKANSEKAFNPDDLTRIRKKVISEANIDQSKLKKVVDQLTGSTYGAGYLWKPLESSEAPWYKGQKDRLPAAPPRTPYKPTPIAEPLAPVIELPSATPAPSEQAGKSNEKLDPVRRPLLPGQTEPPSYKPGLLPPVEKTPLPETRPTPPITPTVPIKPAPLPATQTPPLTKPPIPVVVPVPKKPETLESLYMRANEKIQQTIQSSVFTQLVRLDGLAIKPNTYTAEIPFTFLDPSLGVTRSETKNVDLATLFQGDTSFKPGEKTYKVYAYINQPKDTLSSPRAVFVELNEAQWQLVQNQSKAAGTKTQQAAAKVISDREQGFKDERARLENRYNERAARLKRETDASIKKLQDKSAAKRLEESQRNEFKPRTKQTPSDESPVKVLPGNPRDDDDNNDSDSKEPQNNISTFKKKLTVIESLQEQVQQFTHSLSQGNFGRDQVRQLDGLVGNVLSQAKQIGSDLGLGARQTIDEASANLQKTWDEQKDNLMNLPGNALKFALEAMAALALGLLWLLQNTVMSSQASAVSTDADKLA